MKASRVITQARVLLNDPDKVRWTDAELLGWLNGGQLQLVAVRPDAKSTTIDHTLIAGVEQTIGASGVRVLDVIRNVGGRAITLVSRDQLNEFDPDWYSARPGAAIKHYTFDANAPKAFEVYPPATAGMKVRLLQSVLPTDCASLDADVDLVSAELFEGALIDFVCYRAWSKDGDANPDAQRAANAIATFLQALTGKSQSDQATRPARK
ncbi:hypothetical protein H4CHR_04382 [Variovorax sp. PBS-H4]|uniref:phage adaptor protein n=1 Tax=Variovorax sp. PBS-H4 TaxID=434008 RepID=UPI0013179BB8|nr:DUF6682 family protein [Variovorax sp. PBS-H4]VTU38272.1 hypothetical protein H4CHR_04382 [Variovorax sp. PBS-H4]